MSLVLTRTKNLRDNGHHFKEREWSISDEEAIELFLNDAERCGYDKEVERPFVEHAMQDELSRMTIMIHAELVKDSKDFVITDALKEKYFASIGAHLQNPA
jgi:hypothetical protein